MKLHFPGFYPLGNNDIIDMLDRAAIVLDTDALLCLYKLKEEDALRLLTIIETCRDRLWLPHEVAWLYHHKLNDEILKQINNIQNTLSHFTSCEQNIKAPLSYPYLSSATWTRLEEILHQIMGECNQQKSELAGRLNNCNIKNQIDSLFRGKMGNPYDEGALSNIYREGAERYRCQIPPGFCSTDNPDDRIKYHDLIIWKELQNYASTADKDVVLVTGKVKQDWYYIVDNKIISTLHKLINEFYNFTNKKFHCISISNYVDKLYEKAHLPEVYKLDLVQALSEDTSIESINLSYNETVSNGMNSI